MSRRGAACTMVGTVLGVLVAALHLGSPVGAASAAPPASAASAWPTWDAPQGGVMRHAEQIGDEWVYTNTLWLGLGANADGLEREDYYAEFAPDDPGQMTGDLRRALTYNFFGAGRSVTNGDHELPTDRATWPDGTGEIAELRVQVDADEVFLRVGWHSFPAPTAQVATLTFSASDGGASRQWPAGARVAAPWDVALTVSGAGAVVQTGDAEPAAVTSRVSDHAYEVRLPRAALPGPGPLVVRGGGGLADPADPAVYWEVPPGSPTAATPGSGGPASPTNVWSLLFADDEPWGFDELTQSRLLTEGDVTPARATLDLAALSAGSRTGGPPSPGRVTGDISRIYRSRHDGGDGIQRGAGAIPGLTPPPGAAVGTDFNVSYTRTGRLQDYAMRVPAAYTPARSWPLVVYLHGFGGTPEEAFRLPLGLVDEAEERGYLFASLQGRGDTFYRPGLGELDVVEALADITAEYAVDPDRVYLMGHSMGGYGANNIATRMPDVFAAVAPFQGTDSVELSANLRHVPWLMVTSDQDLDAGGADAEEHYSTLSELGYHATLLRYRLKTHEYSSVYDTLPRLFEHFAAHRRVVDPAVVTWVAPREGMPAPALAHDGAYWLSGVGSGAVTVTSYARPGAPGDDGEAERAVVDPSDEGGPTGRTVAILRTTRPTPAAPRALHNRLDVSATGTGMLTVDLQRAGLVAAGLSICPGESEAFELRLTGAQPGRYEQVTAGSVVAELAATDGRASVAVAPGGCTLLRRAGSADLPPDRGRPGDHTLPATGWGPAAPWALPLLVAGCCALGRRHRSRRT